MRAYLFAMILAMATGAAQARLGESAAELAARYGEPVKRASGGAELTFKKAGFIIVAGVNDAGACDYIVFRKDPGDIGVPVVMTTSEVQTLLEANNGGEAWVKRSGEFDDKWDTPAGRMAIHFTVKQQLFLMTKEGLTRYNETRAAETKKKLDGF